MCTRLEILFHPPTDRDRLRLTAPITADLAVKFHRWFRVLLTVGQAHPHRIVGKFRKVIRCHVSRRVWDRSNWARDLRSDPCSATSRNTYGKASNSWLWWVMRNYSSATLYEIKSLVLEGREHRAASDSKCVKPVESFDFTESRNQSLNGTQSTRRLSGTQNRSASFHLGRFVSLSVLSAFAVSELENLGHRLSDSPCSTTKELSIE